jgi:hypothetical protein
MNMPKSKSGKNTYEVEHRKFATWEKATAFAVGMALESGEDVTITEYGQTGTYYISIRAASEEAG